LARGGGIWAGGREMREKYRRKDERRKKGRRRPKKESKIQIKQILLILGEQKL
jgi:hypothetical protein